MSITFFQSIGDAKKAGIIVMLRQLILFVPAMIIMPKLIGLKAVWFTQPMIDIIVILLGFVMVLKELKRMDNPCYNDNITKNDQ